MALKCLNATLQCMCLQANKAILAHGVIFIAAACLQWEQIGWFCVCNPLTCTINISTEHEGRDTIKTVLEGFDPKLAGVLVVAGALQQKKGISYVWKIVRRKVIVAQWGWWGRAYPHVKHSCVGGKRKVLYHLLYFDMQGSDARLSSFSSCNSGIDFYFLKSLALKNVGKYFGTMDFCQPPTFFRFIVRTLAASLPRLLHPHLT